MINTILKITMSFLLLLTLSIASAQEDPKENSVSVGAVRDQIEGGTVRLMAKLGDTLSTNEQLLVGSKLGNFWVSSREFAIDAADKGKFGSASVRFGARGYALSQSIPEDAPSELKTPIYDGKLSHVFNVHFGADTDRNVKNTDFLVEAAYLPLMKNFTNSCLSLGTAQIIGIGAQLGHQKRTKDPAVSSSQDESGTLKRAKFEYRSKIPLSFKCDGSPTPDKSIKKGGFFDALTADFATWSLLLHSTIWRDFTDKKTYKKHEIVISIPVSGSTTLDLRRDIGAAPVEFDTGAKFGANVTINF